MSNRTLTVKGLGTVLVRPDTINVSMELKTLEKDYSEAVSKSDEKVSALKDAFKKLGFDREDIKTSSYAVNAEYDSVRDDNGQYKRNFSGYSCTHRMNVKFDLDMKKLGKVIAVITECEAEPMLNVEFTVKNTDSVKDELLKKAVADARKNAKVLAKASGVDLGQIITLDYESKNIQAYSNTQFSVPAVMMKTASASGLETEPEDIAFTETVKAVYEIE